MSRKVLFSDKTVYLIIDEVKKHPAIWDNEDPNFSNRYSTAAAWRKISAALELPEYGIRTKWKNLRDTYKKELKRYKMFDLEIHKYYGKWQFFKAMSFLKVLIRNEVDNNEEDKEQDMVEFVVVDEFADQKYHEQEDGASENDENLSSCDSEQQSIAQKQQTFNESYDILFLKSLVPYFKELNPVRKLIMRNKIQELLLNELAVQNSNEQKSLPNLV